MYSRKFAALCLTLLLSGAAVAQTIATKLDKAFQIFLADSQMISGLAGLVVLDAATGKVLYNQNGEIGMAPASTQKVITAATAYEMLGPSFRYETKFELITQNEGRVLRIIPSGDPTLGSFRFKNNNGSAVLQRLMPIQNIVRQGNIAVVLDTSGWQHEQVPSGWIWEDLGNYYGAAPHFLNWRENQYDIVLKSGPAIGSSVQLARTTPQPLVSWVTAAAKGTGDNAYVYPGLFDTIGLIKGTIPVNEDSFTISASHTNPGYWFLQENRLAGKLSSTPGVSKGIVKMANIHTEYSPHLDSISYWFLQKSVNLYGEALIQTIAKQKEGRGSRSGGLRILRSFWQTKGIHPSALNMVDGSGLSPQNRTTPEAQVKVLQYAYSQPWYKGYFEGFPLYNGMKMKSGTIRNVKGFCGYHTSASGTTYIFSFLVNNYAGSASAIVKKMYAVLDVLK